MNSNQRRPNRREFLGSVSCTTAGALLGVSLSSTTRTTHAAQQQAAKTNTRQTFEPATERTEAIARYEGWRFGMFIHFSLNTFLGGSCWDSINDPSIAARKYVPSKLDVDQWISTAALAGMRYAVLTAHHVLGFALWDSKYTEFDVVNSGNTTDVVAEYVEACRKQGVAPGLYYSLGMDEAHRKHQKMTYEQWCNHAQNQITELLTNYGPIPIFWLDTIGGISPAQLQKTYDLIKSIQPDCLVVGNHGYGANGRRIRHFPVDIIAGERSLPPVDGHDPKIEYNGKTYYIPMETCDTICVGTHSLGWFWKPGEQLKEVRWELIPQYKKAVGKKANLLLNVGPNREGRLPDATVKRLLELAEAVKQRKE